MSLKICFIKNYLSFLILEIKRKQKFYFIFLDLTIVDSTIE